MYAAISNRSTGTWQPGHIFTAVALLATLMTWSTGAGADAGSSANGVPQQIRTMQQEITALQQQDLALQQDVSSLKLKVAEQKDITATVLRSIQGQIDELVDNSPTAIRGFDEGGIVANADQPFPGSVVYTMNIPTAGSYVVLAKMTASQRIRDGQGGGCRIVAGGDADGSETVIPNDSVTDSFGNIIDTKSTITLVTSHTFSQENEVILQCWSNGSDILMLSDVEIVALKVGAESAAQLHKPS